MANPEAGKRFDHDVAWWVKWGGLSIALVGAATGVGALVMPGLLAAVGGYAYEQATQRRKPA